MIKEGKFGVQEAVCLITVTMVSKAFYTTPGLLAHILGTSSWYVTLVSAIAAAIGFTFIYFLLRRFPGKNIVEAFNLSMGKYAGSAFSIITLLAIALNAAATLREFIEVLKVYVFPETDIRLLTAIFVISLVVVCYLGLETMARFAKLTAYWLLAGTVAVLALGMQNYNIDRISPVLGYGLEKTIMHGLSGSSAYSEVIILAVIAGSLHSAKYIKRAGYISIALSGILISAVLFCSTMTFPYFLAAEVVSPMYEMTALIDYGRFVQRLDPVFIFVWCISSLIGITVWYYAALSMYCKTFRMQDARPVILPSGIILYVLVLLPREMVTVVDMYIQFSREYLWAIFFLLPMVAFIAAKLRKKGEVRDARIY